MAVFSAKLKPEKGKPLLQKHIAKDNAQAVYAALTEHAKKSTQAENDMEALLTYIITSHFNDGELYIHISSTGSVIGKMYNMQQTKW